MNRFKNIINYKTYIFDFFKLLMGKDIPFYSFEIIIYTINSISKNNKLYQFLLKKYDSSISFIDYESANFIALGGGDESLNLYRKINSNHKLMFEKIYKVDSREFKNTYYYYTEIFKQTSNLGIETPQLVHEIIGGKLAVLYFDFIEIQVNNENVDYLNLFLKFDSLLKKLPPKNVNEIMEYQLFISSSTYQRGKRKIIVDFPEGKRQSVEQFFTNIEKYFMTQKLWFQHIDFHLNNVVNGVFLIDWDTASYYPENYDLGTILSRPIFEKIKNDMHNSDLFKKNIQASNNGKRNVYLEFSIFLHFARFYPEFNFSELFQEFINDYRDKFSN